MYVSCSWARFDRTSCKVEIIMELKLHGYTVHQ